MTPSELIPHPEGGRFQEVFRSISQITTSYGDHRSALTHIYFHLKNGEVSKFHKVTSDEVWNLYQGKLRLWFWDGDSEALGHIDLTPENQCYCYVIPAHYWQAAEPLSDEVLVGCSVGPGFDFVDFTMIDPKSAEANTLQNLNSYVKKFL